jgi:hypothetical protein
MAMAIQTINKLVKALTGIRDHIYTPNCIGGDSAKLDLFLLFCFRQARPMPARISLARLPRFRSRGSGRNGCRGGGGGGGPGGLIGGMMGGLFGRR